MNPLFQQLPIGRVWIEVQDLPAALLALEVLSTCLQQQHVELSPRETDDI